MNLENDLNLTLNEPPLKKFKKQLEKLSDMKPDIAPVSISELSPASLKVQLQADASLISSQIPGIESPKESNLDKWRKSFQASNSSLKGSAVVETGIEEISLLSDDFFVEPNLKDEFDFDLEGISEIDQESLFETSKASKYESNDPYHRVKIIKIQESFYLIEGKAFQFPQKIVECLIVENDISNIGFEPIKAVIREDWLHCKISEESIINVVGPIKNGEIIIDNEQNYLVVEPDVLINNTSIADSFSCLRKAVIAYRTQVSVEDTKPNSSLICGSIVHELVEEAFKTGNFKEINESDLKLNLLIAENIEKIFCCEKDEKFVKEKVLETMKNFPKWCNLYMRKLPAIHAYVQDPTRKTNASSGSDDKATICISKVLDLEENIWSVMFGLKGKVDATLLTKYKKGNAPIKTVVTPFELKTGQTTTSVAHRAQTLLYTLLLFDRYKRPIDYGLLFYISTGDLIRMPSFRDEIRAILIKRNQLAEEIVKNDQLPCQVRNEYLCKQCNHLDSCIMFHRLLENGTKETSSIPKQFELKTEHLNCDDDKEDSILNNFFKKWQELITQEEAESVKTRSELWRFDSGKRAGRGKCLNEMELISTNDVSCGYECTFKKPNNDQGLKMSLLNSYINERDPVVISSEDPINYAIATGIVKTITVDYITIVTDRPIKLGPMDPDVISESDDSVNNNNTHTENHHNLNTHNHNLNIKFCIDKNELTGSFGLLRANLIKLYSGECQKLLNLIVNQRPPKYLPRSSSKFDEETLKRYEGMYEDYIRMDSDQKEAFFKSIETVDYLLILGMPGTGKSTTLSFIIRYLVLIEGKTILISSHTHSAIDHIAIKLQERNLPFLRIGNGEKIDIQIKAENILETMKFQSVSEVEHVYSSARVVISTSLGMNHSIFMRKRFDFCLVDEASQLTLPACLGSLKVANSFILVGDHYQLPPLVRSKEALKNGFGDSLFKILAEKHPQAMVKLCNQYRMNDEIMLMANRLTYQNLLKCASETVSKQVLEIKNCEVKYDWLKRILSPNCKVAFLNTDNLSFANETVNGNSFHNEGESIIIKTIVKEALSCGVKGSQISLISPYRPQLKYLNFSNDPVISQDHPIISTIDKYQGKDSDFVIISLVRSNSNGNIGELLNDWQRLNVAFTRAKKKLILIGSHDTVLQNASFRKLKELIDERDWLINLEMCDDNEL